MKALFAFLFLAVCSVSHLAKAEDDPVVGQRCKALRPLKAADKVGGVNCYCEASAFVAGAGFNGSGSAAYYPIRLDALYPSYPVSVSTDSNFTTLVNQKKLAKVADEPEQIVETYNYYQSSDSESGAGRFLLARVFVLVQIHDSRTVTCNPIRSEIPYADKYL